MSDIRDLGPMPYDQAVERMNMPGAYLGFRRDWTLGIINVGNEVSKITSEDAQRMKTEHNLVEEEPGVYVLWPARAVKGEGT